MNPAAPRSTHLRVVTFNVLPIAFSLVSQWATETGNQLVLAVTTPGPSTRRSTGYQQIVNAAPPGLDVLVTTHLRSVALPLIRELQPDLIVSFSFPYRILPEIRAIPRYGAVNLHPTPLPAYRGPNVMRLYYEGWPTMGATLHWMADDFDTGNVLSLQSAPVPEPLTTQSMVGTWRPLMIKAFTEGIERALAGEPGTPQDHAQASYAAAFTEAEFWLDLSEPVFTIQRRYTALNLFEPGHAKVQIGENGYSIEQLQILPDQSSTVAPATLINQAGNILLVQALDGQVRLTTKPLANPN